VSFRHARLAGGPRTCVGLSLSGCARQATLHVLPGRCSIPDGRAGGEWPHIFGAPWAIRWLAHSSSAQPNLGRASAAPGAVPVWVENPLALPICAAPRIVPFILRPRWGPKAVWRARCWASQSNPKPPPSQPMPQPRKTVLAAIISPLGARPDRRMRTRVAARHGGAAASRHAGRKNCGNGPPMGYAGLPWRVNWRTGSA
jgi:hypothetical protein